MLFERKYIFLFNIKHIYQYVMEKIAKIAKRIVVEQTAHCRNQRKILQCTFIKTNVRTSERTIGKII